MENSVGFQEFILKPVFPSELEHADVIFTSGYGDIKSSWQRQGKTIHWQFEIPNNSSAWVILPDQEKQQYQAGKYSLVINL